MERAFLLAGGLGSRLHPLTLDLPKCLVPVAGRPLLDYWLALCRREGITDVLLNVSQHVALVERWLAAHRDAPRVRLVHEEHPVGNAGTVARNRTFVEGQESFWILYSDNLTDVRLDDLRRFHASHDGLATLALFHAPDPRAAGIVELAPDGRIMAVAEKPEQPRGSLANAGIYLARQALFDAIPASDGIVDFGFDVFPRCAGRLYGREIEGFLMDIGTPAALERARLEWPIRAEAPA
jgi:mannose-1-phosphate guanylyltransferase